MQIFGSTSQLNYWPLEPNSVGSLTYWPIDSESLVEHQDQHSGQSSYNAVQKEKWPWGTNITTGHLKKETCSLQLKKKKKNLLLVIVKGWKHFHLINILFKLLTLEDGKKHKHSYTIGWFREWVSCMENDTAGFDCGYVKKLLITLSPL